MAEEVKMDDVGNAEAVLNRLINERKSLEAAQQVLETYRMVKGQLEPAVRQLKELEQRVKDAQKRLEDVEGSIENAQKKVDGELEGYRERIVERVEKEIADLKRGYDELDMEYDKLVVKMEEEGAKHEVLVRGRSEELERLDRDLAIAKREHGALSEAINSAAAFFKG